MSNIDKHALREAAEKATKGEWRAFTGAGGTCSIHTAGDERFGDVVDWPGFDGQRNAKANAKFIAAANPATVLALLDELEAEKERSEEFLRQARSFREAHESASEIIRKLERNKPTVKLPTTRLWAGKISCYEESEVVAMLEGAGISIAAGIGKG